jgi:hypothetical protein
LPTSSRVGVTIAAFFATTFFLFMFYLYFAVSGLRHGLLWSLLIAVPVLTVVGFVTWGAHRGRRAAVAIFTLWGCLIGLWGGTAAPWAVGRLRTEMRTIKVPAAFQLQLEYDYEGQFHREWRVLGTKGTDAELRTQMLQILVDAGFAVVADGSGTPAASRGRLRAYFTVLPVRGSGNGDFDVTLVLYTPLFA